MGPRSIWVAAMSCVFCFAATAEAQPLQSDRASVKGATPRSDAAPPEDEHLPADPDAADWTTRARLFGDLGGVRSSLADWGLTFDVLATEYYQGVATGGRRRQYEFGGKLDYLANFDGDKLGHWRGFKAVLHAETRYGRDVNRSDGLLSPSNFFMLFPEADRNVTAVTGLKLTQAIGERFSIYGGKVNTLDEYPLRYQPIVAGLPGREFFLNSALVYNPVVARTLPYSAAGFGGAILRDGEPFLSVAVFDPEERATKGLEGLYGTGAVVVPDLFLRVSPFGRPGVYNFNATYSTARYLPFERAARLNLPLPGLNPPEGLNTERTGSWSVSANFYQAAWVDPTDNTRTWGLFGQVGLADGNPNPLRYAVGGGLAGHSMVPGRERDIFGVGYFYLGLSDDFKTLARPLLPQRDEYGVELFYNYAVTPWFRLTGDIQVVRPSTSSLDTAIITGLRAQLNF